MTKLHDLANMGQAIWLDFIQRSLMESGQLQALIDQGLRGMTSNPSIFDKAISKSGDYDEDLAKLAAEGKSPEAIYEALAVEDIRNAADLLRPVYDATQGLDGYVSLEVSPLLANDTQGTLAEARHLHALVNRPNIFIKVPATPAGVPAIEALISEGINVNVTLIFSLSQYEPIANAYIAGLEQRVNRGQDISMMASVASFFVSRVDTAVDKELEKLGHQELQGVAAIANARCAYALYQRLFGSERWQRLAERGAHVQRPLWASTSAKNPAYRDVIYVEQLIGPQTVNTVPMETLLAFMDHGCVAPTLEAGMDEAAEQLQKIASLGIDLEQITAKLQADGVDAFIKSFRSLIDTVAAKAAR
jgi:transaldolase